MHNSSSASIDELALGSFLCSFSCVFLVKYFPYVAYSDFNNYRLSVIIISKQFIIRSLPAEYPKYELLAPALERPLALL